MGRSDCSSGAKSDTPQTLRPGVWRRRPKERIASFVATLSPQPPRPIEFESVLVVPEPSCFLSTPFGPNPCLAEGASGQHACPRRAGNATRGLSRGPFRRSDPSVEAEMEPPASAVAALRPGLL